jgi:hypothetical protein
VNESKQNIILALVGKANKKPKNLSNIKTRGVSHCGLVIYITKYLNAKDESSMETENIPLCKNIA